MIIYSRKNISKWAWWQKKGAFLFCITNGLIWGSIYFVFHLLLRISISPAEHPFLQSLSIGIGVLLCASFLSIALWYDNQRRYKEWQQDKKD